jgi:hypothetical protein
LLLPLGAATAAHAPKCSNTRPSTVPYIHFNVSFLLSILAVALPLHCTAVPTNV